MKREYIYALLMILSFGALIVVNVEVSDLNLAYDTAELQNDTETVERLGEDLMDYSNVYVQSCHVIFLVLCLLVSLLSKKLKYSLLSCVSWLFFGLSLGSFMDEIFSQDPSVVSKGEYVGCFIGVILCIFDYLNFNPLKTWTQND